MPKPVPLTPAIMDTPQVTPQAATPPRTAPRPAALPRKVPQTPLQVRLPRDEVRAIKIAAAEREQTISEFMLACFHAYMQNDKHA